MLSTSDEDQTAAEALPEQLGSNLSTSTSTALLRLRRLQVLAPSTPKQLISLVNSLLTLAATLGLGLLVQLLVLVCWGRIVNRKYYRQVEAGRDRVRVKGSKDQDVTQRAGRRWRATPAHPLRSSWFRRLQRSTRVRPAPTGPCPSPPPTPPPPSTPPRIGETTALSSWPTGETTLPAPEKVSRERAPDKPSPPSPAQEKPPRFLPFPKLFVWPNLLVVILAMFASGLAKASVTILASQPLDGCETLCLSAAISTISCVGGFLLLLGGDLLLFRRRFRSVTFKKAQRAAQPHEVDARPHSHPSPAWHSRAESPPAHRSQLRPPLAPIHS